MGMADVVGKVKGMRDDFICVTFLCLCSGDKENT